MSISDQISRLQDAKSDIKTAIENKGVTVPSTAKLDTYNSYINSITTGTDVSNTTATESDVLHPEYFYNSSGTRVQGTMANNGSLGTTTLTKSNSSKTIPAGYTSGGTVKISTTNLSAGNIKADVTVVGVTGTFTSDGTATSADIYENRIAYVNGDKLTGTYVCVGRSGKHQWNAASTDCSATELVIPCEFEPRCACAVYQSSTYSNNYIVCAYYIPSAMIYHTKTSSGVARTQLTSGLDSYFWYDSSAQKVHFKSASTTYKWSTNNYRVFIFK